MANSYDLRRAVEARRLLNSFLLDLAVGTRGLDIFDLPDNCAQRKSQTAIGLNRMAISHLIVSLAKWTEFYRHYRTILPADARDACLALHHQIIAAALSTSATQLSVIYSMMIQSGPLTSREIDERFERVIGWINNTTANIFRTG
jgi:hypothetical protein